MSQKTRYTENIIEFFIYKYEVFKNLTFKLAKKKKFIP